MPHYTQIFVRTERSTQALSALKGLEVGMLPGLPLGTLVGEKSSEAIDVRIIIQVARSISWNLGRGCAVLAIAGGEEGGFWCGLVDGGERRFEHNRLTGPRGFTSAPASRADVEALCDVWGAEVDREGVYESLNSDRYESAVDRHAAFARGLGLPAWSAGVGYARIVAGDLPPEAGTPQRPARCLAELGVGFQAPEEEIVGTDPLAIFQHTCRWVFRFLGKDSRYREEPGELTPGFTDSPIHQGVYLIGPMHLRPAYRNPYTLCYRSEHLIVVIEGLSFGTRTRLCLIDREGQHLDLTKLVALRNPVMLDLCRLAESQREQIPIFAEALRTCAADVLDGDLQAISPIAEKEPGFSFSAFATPLDSDYILASYGPPLEPRTIEAQIRRAAYLDQQEAELLKKKAQ
jgi:hypothetical protein